MTIAEALKSSVGYPLNESSIEKACIDRGLNMNDDYTGATENIELARADLLVLSVTTPSISEGGFSISFSEKKEMMAIANRIYSKYGEPVVSIAPIVQDKSYIW